MTQHRPPTISLICQMALGALRSDPTVWRTMPLGIRKTLHEEGLVAQNRCDEWRLTDLGHQVIKHIGRGGY